MPGPSQLPGEHTAWQPQALVHKTNHTHKPPWSYQVHTFTPGLRGCTCSKGLAQEHSVNIRQIQPSQWSNPAISHLQVTHATTEPWHPTCQCGVFRGFIGNWYQAISTTVRWDLGVNSWYCYLTKHHVPWTDKSQSPTDKRIFEWTMSEMSTMIHSKLQRYGYIFYWLCEYDTDKTCLTPTGIKLRIPMPSKYCRTSALFTYPVHVAVPRIPQPGRCWCLPASC